MNKEILSLAETSQYLKLTIDNLYRLTSEKKIPHFKPSKKLLFDRIELDQWLEQNAVKPKIKLNHE
jgi:excisionase family DNA binding protein